MRFLLSFQAADFFIFYFRLSYCLQASCLFCERSVNRLRRYRLEYVNGVYAIANKVYRRPRCCSCERVTIQQLEAVNAVNNTLEPRLAYELSH